jgi:molecular chaperone GrpE
MIFNQYGEIFKKLGVESFGEKGEIFDPNIHNAVMHDEDAELPENSISDVFSIGYKMGDRVIRPAIVKVVN